MDINLPHYVYASPDSNSLITFVLAYVNLVNISMLLQIYVHALVDMEKLIAKSVLYVQTTLL